jgi:hypothetical protein
MRRFLTAALVLGLLNLAGAARADDKPSPTGTWKWTVERNGQTFDLSLKLKAEGDKLTGALVRNDEETKIEDGTFKDGEVSFTVVREFNGNKITFKYKGKVEGDTIKGKTEVERDGQTMTRDWEAKRAKE